MMLAQKQASRALPVIAAFTAFAGFCALQIWAYALAGAFEYPLDDPYIHLAMAKGIARGTYGVNAGEVASAASSILYPVLLLPLVGSKVQIFAPMIVNALAVTGAGALWGGILAAAGYRGTLALALAGVGPLALNMHGVAFSGLEHELHVGASLLMLLGIDRLVRRGRVAWWFAAAIVAAPLLRLEGLALSGLSLCVLAIYRRFGWALSLCAAVAATLGGFMAYLASLGLPPLPGSVIAKLSQVSAPQGGGVDAFLTRLAEGFTTNLWHQGGLILGALVVLTILIPIFAPRMREGGRMVILRVAGGAGLAHLALGQVGWMDRYEHYAIVTLVSALLLSMAGLSGRDHLRMAGVIAIAFVLSISAYQPKLIKDYVWGPWVLHVQHAQMARFARLVEAPVAVNDLGRVTLDNPNYVLDIMGLGNAEALAQRQARPANDVTWLEPLLKSHDVQVAMVYDNWFGGEMKSTGWTRIGTLAQRPSLRHPEPILGPAGSIEVAFYAPPDVAERMTALAVDWAKDLPEGAQFKLGLRAGDGEILTRDGGIGTGALGGQTVGDIRPVAGEP
ncbi:hypothetical protein [Albirhodobacter sp. R86504]|uniref:hypothetical protein n=1 Tax=Albirhodobacter sp. R86504 TaxID=3093848 RepID=UPI00366B1F6D